MNYRAHRAEKLFNEIEEESRNHQSEVKTAMASLREALDRQEEVLLDEIRKNENAQKTPIEEYKRQLQGEQQMLIEQIVKFVKIDKGKTPDQLLKAKPPFDEYRKRADEKLSELRPGTRNRMHIVGFDKLKAMETEVRNLKLEGLPVYKNDPLKQRIDSAKTSTTLDLHAASCTDQDIELVAAELAINKVSRSV